jgi:hypothetical protein
MLAAGRWSSQGNPVSSTSKTDHYDITEILLKVALNTIILINKMSRHYINRCQAVGFSVNIFTFYLELQFAYKNKFKKFDIRTSKFKFSFRGLYVYQKPAIILSYF